MFLLVELLILRNVANFVATKVGCISRAFIPQNYCQNRIVLMKGHNFTSILYRYIFYHSTLEFWLRSQCQQITPSTYKYVLLPVSYTHLTLPTIYSV